MINKWKMNRAGLLNFWYYDDEVFNFSGGKLLLRGSNGSGKSVTMQSFLPVLLDGKKTPDRLDPFGSKARRMEDYLLGEKEVVDRDERTGYLFIEYKKGDTDQYITTGIGLQAKRNKPMKFWGFVITDGRRIGYDFNLYKVEKNGGEKQKIPRSRIELETVIGEGGHIDQTQKGYMALVNKYIFGFETLEAYEDLIKLLIQLRSPKLSKDFRPTVIYEILEAALPPLTDDDLRHLSDTIEQMDHTKQQIEQLDREWQAILKVNQAYDQYNQRRLLDQGQGLLHAGDKLDAENKILQFLQKKQKDLDQEIEQISQEKRQLDQQQDVFQKKQERLKSHKVWNLEKELRNENERLREEDQKLNKSENQVTELAKKEVQFLENKSKSEVKKQELENKLNDQLEDMNYSADESSFSKHEMNVDDYFRVREHGFDFTVWKKETASHLKEMEDMVEHFRMFQRLKENYEEKDVERAEEVRQLDQLQLEEKQWIRVFEEDVEKKRSEIYEWVQGVDWVIDSEEKLQQSSRLLETLYKTTNYDEVKSPFRNAYDAFEEIKRKKRTELTVEKEQLEEKREKKKQELKAWREKKDPEPETAEETKLSREELRRNGHDFIPLYAAIEFQDHIPSNVRQRIEGVLFETGLLDALIVNQEVPIIHDRVLTTNPAILKQTLADYLKPDPEAASLVSVEKVDEILRSIIVDQDNEYMVINEDGSYQIGLLKGHALPYEEVRFIGRSARKRYREEKINELELELAKLGSEIEAILMEIQVINKQIDHGKEQLNRFPADDDLKEGDHQVEKIKIKVTQQQEQVEKLDHQVKQLYRKYQDQKYVVDERARLFDLEKTLDSYVNAKGEISRYKDDLFGIEKLHTEWINEKNRLDELSDRIEDVIFQIDELRGELNVINDRVERLKQQVSEIEKQLKREGADDIRQQINEVEDTLLDITEKLKNVNRKLPEKEKDKEYGLLELEKQSERSKFWDSMKKTWLQSFKQEIDYHFVFNKQEVEEVTELELAKNAQKEFKKLVTEKDSSRIDRHLTSMFYSEGSNLMEYRMNDYHDYSAVPEWMHAKLDDEYQPFIEQWKQKSSRRLIDMDYQGKRVSPYYIQEIIEKDRARQESLLNEQDEELFKDILFKSVGTKLRSRIRRAKAWTKKMDHLMETRDTSSGLTFSIRWKPRTADVEEELDTKDLVDLLMRDARLLKEEDFQRITGHFRSKLANAKQLLDTKTEGQTLLQVLKEVLDYRKWFSFVLSFKRENEPKRELTNHAFYKFSGGEKAMAMYIPLFTACYSRYQEADESAPYIISLDEAFAGVDENNIREMFEIVEHLDFNYIMNSQVLWGDYDTISELSICELVRPKNADFVSVIHYQWDGKKLSVADLETKEPKVIGS